MMVEIIKCLIYSEIIWVIFRKQRFRKRLIMLISVVIPTHNRAKILTRSITSALSQTHSNIEVIVVSDGSEDNTKDVVNYFEKNDERIKFISYLDAKGANYARNKGAQAASGEYIAFLDDDDEWLPYKLEKQLEKFKENENIGLVSSSVEIIYEKDKVKYNSISNKEGDLSKKILYSNCIGSTSTVMVKTNIFKKVGGFDENLGALQDYDLWIRICQKAYVGAVEDICVRYYNQIGSAQISGQTEKYEDAYRYINKKYEKLIRNLTKSEIKARNKRQCFGLTKRALRNKDKKSAIKYLIQASKTGLDFKIIMYFFLLIFNYSFILKIKSLNR